MGGDEVVGEADEVAVVDDAGSALAFGVRLQRVGEIASGRRGVGVVVGGQDVGRAPKVVAEPGPEARQLAHPVRPGGQVEARAFRCAEGVGEEPPRPPGRRDRRAPMDADERPVLAQDGVSEAVIGEDLDLASLGGEMGQVAVQPVGELLGRLVRERDAERLLGLDAPIRDECGEAGCHRRGLAGPGAGDDA